MGGFFLPPQTFIEGAQFCSLEQVHCEGAIHFCTICIEDTEGRMGCA